MIRATPLPKNPGTSTTPAAPAEPERRIVFIMQTLDGVKLSPLGAIEIPASYLDMVVDSVKAVADSCPRSQIQLLGRPGTRLIVTNVDKEDPEFVGKSEDRPNIGEVYTVPDVVDFFTAEQKPISAQLVRYYLKQRKPYVKCGYTFQDMEDFKRELSGPSGKHLHAIAEANIAWAQANHREPLT